MSIFRGKKSFPFVINFHYWDIFPTMQTIMGRVVIEKAWKREGKGGLQMVYVSA